MKFIKYISIFLLFLTCVILAIVLYISYSTQLSPSESRSFKALHGKVTITRDQYGIPHIIAEASDLDAYFALGFAHAQDRFWQMEFQRHVVSGTLSELFGSKTLEADKLLRTFGFFHAAEEALPSFDPRTQQIIHSYTQGINAFLENKRLPLQFKLLRYSPKPWTDVDSIAWQKMMAYNLQNAWKVKIENYLIARQVGKNQIPVLSPSYPKNAPTILDDRDLAQSGLLLPTSLTRSSAYTKNKIISRNPDEGIGSNNWVISGKLSATGKPILANDPHLGFNSPIIWYLAEIKGPTLHVIGGTIPGIPTVIIGRNDHIAWGMTNVNPNTQDLYIEDESTPLKTVEEIIHVKDSPDFILPVQKSVHGVIISSVTDAGKISPHVALKWTALQPNDTTVQSMIKMNYAQNWNAFVNALEDFVVPSQNFVYADVQNNIGYYLPGHIPLRSEWDGELPVPAKSHQEWTGMIPFKQLPHVYNPSKSFIASANNKPITDHYLYRLSYVWRESPFRIERILEMLKAKSTLTLDDMKTIQLDDRCNLWIDLRQSLLTTKPLDKRSETALSSLQKWDGKSDIENTNATIFAYWFRELTHLSGNRLSAFPHWTNALFIQDQLMNNGSYCLSQTTKNCAEFLSHTLQQGMQNLTHDLGNNPSQWQWGKIHQAEFQELGVGKSDLIGWIWNRKIATPGNEHSVNNGSFYLNNFMQDKGAGYRQIIDLGNFDQSLYSIALGQNDNPLSAHFDDMMKPWRDGKYVTISSDPKSWGKTQTLVFTP